MTAIGGADRMPTASVHLFIVKEVHLMIRSEDVATDIIAAFSCVHKVSIQISRTYKTYINYICIGLEKKKKNLKAC